MPSPSVGPTDKAVKLPLPLEMLPGLSAVLFGVSAAGFCKAIAHRHRVIDRLLANRQQNGYEQ
jgi:hypothetical protein